MVVIPFLLDRLIQTLVTRNPTHIFLVENMGELGSRDNQAYSALLATCTTVERETVKSTSTRHEFGQQ